MEALGHGNNAIAEIANIQAVYGQLVQTIKTIELPNGRKIVLKQPTELVKFKPAHYKGVKGSWEGSVSELLRVLIQAAVDNPEFMLLHQWGYDQNLVYNALFKYEGTKKTISQNDFNTFISPLIKKTKLANTIRNGMTYTDGHLGLAETIAKSSELFTFVQDRNSDLNTGADYIMHEDAVTPPVEAIALLPYRLFQENVSKYEKIGLDGSPVRLNEFLHYNAHMDAVERMDAEIYDLLARAVLKDKGTIKGQKGYIKTQQRKGTTYAIKMGKEFYRILGGISNPTSSTMDRNEDMIEFQEKFNKEYKNLSETAKVAATIKFIQGITMWRKGTQSIKSKTPHFLPPASLNNVNLQTLHEGVLQKFYEYYNEVTNNPTSRDLRASKRLGKYTPTMDIIERFGC